MVAVANARDLNRLIADRRALADKLIRLQARLAPDLLLIDQIKESLREISDATGESFSEEVRGIGSVEVKAGSERKYKGKLPILKFDTWLGLSPARKQSLADQGLVVEEDQWTPARKASVTVRL